MKYFKYVPFLVLMSSLLVIDSAFAQNQSLGDMAKNVTGDVDEYGTLFTALAYLIGTVMVIAGLVMVSSDKRSQQGKSKVGPSVAIVVGAFLVVYQLAIGAITQTVYKTTPTSQLQKVGAGQ